MNTPNPLHPQGAFLENRGRSQIQIAFFAIVAIHVVLLGALLLQGCKRTTEPPAEPTNLVPYEPPPAVMPPVVITSAPPPLVPPVLPPPVVPPPSPPVTPPVEPPALAGTQHAVVRGDTFSDLAKKYGTTVRAIAEANPGVEPTRLQIGQLLVIPPPSPTATAPPTAPDVGGPAGEQVYTVKSGDNLTRIAREYGVTVKQLRSYNNLRTDMIKVGQKLKIPAKAPEPPPARVEPAPALPPPFPETVPSLPPPNNF